MLQPKMTWHMPCHPRLPMAICTKFEAIKGDNKDENGGWLRVEKIERKKYKKEKEGRLAIFKKEQRQGRE